MNRRAAIAALTTALPGFALAKDQPITWGKPNEGPRYLAIVRPDGRIEIPLDGWPGWRVTYAGESIDIAPAEIMAALRPLPPASNVNLAGGRR